MALGPKPSKQPRPHHPHLPRLQSGDDVSYPSAFLQGSAEAQQTLCGDGLPHVPSTSLSSPSTTRALGPFSRQTGLCPSPQLLGPGPARCSWAPSAALFFPLLSLSPGQAKAGHSLSSHLPLCLTEVGLSARHGSGVSSSPRSSLTSSGIHAAPSAYRHVLASTLLGFPSLPASLVDRAETLSNPSPNPPHLVQSPAQISLRIC